MTKSPFNQALTSLVNSIRRYLDIRMAMVKLDVMEKSAKIISLTIAGVFLITIFMLFLLFTTLAAAIWVGELLHNQALGYLCIAGAYLLLGLILFLVRRRLFLSIVIKHLSEIFFEEKKEDDEEEN